MSVATRDGAAIVPREASVADVAARLRDDPGPYIVATHRNPDGDAIGSALAVARALRAHGREAIVWHPDVPAVPADLEFLTRPGDQVVTRLPDDAYRRTMVVVDCATAGRLSDQDPATLAGFLVNIDHHHDNGRFGDLNLVDGGCSSSAELVLRVLDEAGWGVDPAIAEALHVGIVTDTGRLSYSNVTGDTLRADARLIDAGVDVAATARRLYENVPLAQARLLGIAFTRAQALLDGRLLVSILDLDDFETAGTDDADGIAEALRAIRGVEVGAVLRHLHGGGLRVSMRAASERVDVSAIAREHGGGGHRAAAGMSWQGADADLLEWLCAAVAAQLDGK